MVRLRYKFTSISQGSKERDSLGKFDMTGFQNFDGRMIDSILNVTSGWEVKLIRSEFEDDVPTFQKGGIYASSQIADIKTGQNLPPKAVATYLFDWSI